MAYNYQDIINNQKENKISALLTIEDGRSVNTDLEKIKKY
jgi:membrane dipeptidase